jgi:hypothetical protein
MPDFASAQSQLSAARNALAAAQLAASQAGAGLAETQESLDSALRGTPANRAGLEAAARRAQQSQASAQKAFEAARDAVATASGAFASFSNPQQNVARLSADSPFVLFPVRIETRFRTSPVRSAAAAAGSHELLVRIYPDDCSIDTFEPIFSQSELFNVKAYWMNIARAGGVEAQRRVAWRALVAAHGSGRAGWLADQFSLVNAGTLPLKASPSDEILVIPTNTALSAADASATAEYWQAVWIADGDSAKVTAANSALAAAVGASRAAELVAGYVPFNLSDAPLAPLKKADVAVQVAFAIFPPDPPTTVQSWSQAPQVRQFPDRFVVVGFNDGAQTLEAVGSPVTLPLYTGPDPTADPATGIHPVADGLFIPPQLKWMVDFDQAVAAGMGIAIPLTAQQYAAGFTRLLVVGLQLGLSTSEGSAALQELFAHHQASRNGFSIVPQGTPTHNSTGASAGAKDDADASFDDREQGALFTPVSDPTQKRDGQWLSEFLSLDSGFVSSVHGSGGMDQMRARAMQTALWPATWGYWMDTLFTPAAGATSVFSDDAIENTRSFFTSFVSGRGPLPAIRIAGQPYGILPTTAFSHIAWYDGGFLGTLAGLLRKLDAEWTTLSQSAAFVGKPGDPQQILLDILALQPSSVEYYSRNAEGLAQLFNMANRFALGPLWFAKLSNLGLEAQATALLQQLGYAGATPDLLNHFFLTDNPQIDTVIDDRALSETSPVRPYTDDGRNYLQWLSDAAASSLDTLRAETGFSGNQSPRALLYLFLRHALLLGFYDASYRLHRDAGFLTAPQLQAMRTEPSFVHVAEASGSSESRYAALYKTESRITGNTTQLVADYIGQQLGSASAAADLAAQVSALKILTDASTAELDRLFSEHVDTCSYRYDAWALGLVHQRIASLNAAGAKGQTPRGIYLGAYAWVENLRPSTAKKTTPQLPADLAAQFAGASPLLEDPDNGGYIFAPSLPQANASAVLRAGFLAAQSGGVDSGQLSVNLSSSRVRAALALIEGIRNGQSLGALLGYQFETVIHDAYSTAEVDKFIYPLRKAFPLVADALAPTKTDASVPIEAIEARNVIDGKKLVDQITTSGVLTYPWGVTGLPAASPTEQLALNGAADALRNSYDALADLALAEGVYQAVQGNYARVAGTSAAYATGDFPPEPEIVNTSPPGIGLTHRFGIQFRTGLAALPGATPRAQAEPAIDDWLTGVLPSLDQIGCTVAWSDPVTGAAQERRVTLADLGLRPLDAIYLLKTDDGQAMAELDDRIQRYAFTTWNPRPDAVVQIQYRNASGAISMFETGALLSNLRPLLLHSRPLRPTDIRRANDSTSADDAAVFVDASRITTPLASLTHLAAEIDSFLTTTLAPLLTDPAGNRAQIIAQVDSFLAQTIGFLERAARLAVPSSGWGFALNWLHTAFADIFAAVANLTARWTSKLMDFASALTAYDALPFATRNADRFSALQSAALLVSSKLDPLPPDPGTLRTSLPAKASTMQGRLQQFQAIQASGETSFASLYASVIALSTSEFDLAPFDVSPIGDRAIVIAQDIANVLGSQLSTANSRVASVNSALAAAQSQASQADRAATLVGACKALFGDDFQMIPEFGVSADQGTEWNNALNASTSGRLFTYAQTSLNIDFPADEWFYGAARVRQPLSRWESVLMLAAAFGRTPPAMTAMQLPFETGAPWLAVQFPETFPLSTDHLLYTCVYTQPFDPPARQCGVMIDEWTEVIPASTRDAAIAFNYNRPDNEPAQAILLVTSPSNGGNWQWAFLVDALNETLDLAKKRAVEPAFLDSTAYSRFLPATVTASTTYGITIATPITAANGVMETLQGGTNA